MRTRRLLPAAVIALACAFASARPASAHPLGNLTQNTYSGIVIAADGVHVDEVLDLAELPTVQARQHMDLDSSGDVSPTELSAWATSECTALADGLRVRVGGEPVRLVAGTPVATFVPGQGGLDTARVECPLSGPATIRSTTRLEVTDTNFTDRIGWREMTVVGDGTTVTGTGLATSSVSGRLTSYPTSGAPRRDLTLDATVRPGGAAAAIAVTNPILSPATRGADRLTRAFTDLAGDRHLTLGAGALAALVAMVLGAFHALAPGHGKSVMAAYVVGRRGTLGQVATIGVTVVLTHTAGVLVLGTIVWLSQSVAPDHVLPWLTLASGLLLAATGVGLLVRRVRTGQPAHHHHLGGLGHEHDHDHNHHDHDHDHDHHHDHDHDHHDGADPLPSRRWLVAMGLAGGMVPTPTAIVVLLGAVALGRTWFGVVLVALYGVGMAATLMAAGVAMVRLSSWLERHWYGSRWLTATVRVAPVLTSAALVTAGLLIVGRSGAIG